MTNWILAVALIVMVFPSAGLAQTKNALVGTWKLVSWQVITENETPQNLFGSNPKGYLILTSEGRSIVVTTAGNRKGGMGDAERAALHKSMLAYSGKYRVESNDFITLVDVSWNEEWNGTDAIIGSKAISSSSSRHRHQAYCSQARLISAGSCGSGRNRALRRELAETVEERFSSGKADRVRFSGVRNSSSHPPSSIPGLQLFGF